MFDPLEDTVDQELARERAACWRELGEIGEREALGKQRAMELARPQSAADALVALTTRSGTTGGGSKRASALLVVHVSDDAPAMLEGAGPISDETTERLTCGEPPLLIKRAGDDIVHRREARAASEPQKRAMHHRSPHTQYPACTATRDLEAHHITPWALGGRTHVGKMILLCPRHHDYLHDHGIRTSGTGDDPIFTSADGRLITANQPHAPPS